MRAEKEQVVEDVSLGERAREKIHSLVAPSQLCSDAGAPESGPSASVRPCAIREAPSQPYGFGGVTPLSGQRARKADILFHRRVCAHQRHDDRMRGIAVTRGVVSLCSLEAEVIGGLLGDRLTRVPGERACERDAGAAAVAVCREIERDLAHHRRLLANWIGAERVDLPQARGHFLAAAERRKGDQLCAKRGEVRWEMCARLCGDLELAIVSAEQVIGVGQPVVIGRTAAEGAAFGVQLLEDLDRLARPAEVERITRELLLPHLRLGARVGQRTCHRVRGREIAAAPRHLPVELQLLQMREAHQSEAARDGFGGVAPA